jgi:hypothetical protein
MANMTGTERLEWMKKALAEGGSVTHNGRQIFRVDDLPKLTELASNDKEREEAAADLERRRKALDDETARFTQAEADLTNKGAGTEATLTGAQATGAQAGAQTQTGTQTTGDAGGSKKGGGAK